MTPTPSKTAVRRLAAARLISITGGSALCTALMFTVYQLTHSPTWLSATLVLTPAFRAARDPDARTVVSETAIEPMAEG